MYLENLVLDASSPADLGRFWSEALGLEPLTDLDGVFEARLRVPGGPELDLCFQQVPEPRADPRLHLDLSGGDNPAAVVERLLGLGASRLDLHQGDVAWTVLADVEGNSFCVREPRASDRRCGPVAEIPIDSADPGIDAAFWAELTGWQALGQRPTELRHPSGRGPLLSFWPEPEPKGAKNALHLDLRLEVEDDPAAVLARIEELGGCRVDPGWGELAWTVLADPSGNEFCLLPGRSGLNPGADVVAT